VPGVRGGCGVCVAACAVAPGPGTGNVGRGDAVSVGRGVGVWVGRAVGVSVAAAAVWVGRAPVSVGYGAGVRVGRVVGVGEASAVDRVGWLPGSVAGGVGVRSGRVVDVRDGGGPAQGVRVPVSGGGMKPGSAVTVRAISVARAPCFGDGVAVGIGRVGVCGVCSARRVSIQAGSAVAVWTITVAR